MKSKIIFPPRKYRKENPKDLGKKENEQEIKYNLEGLAHSSTRYLYQNRLDNLLNENTEQTNTDMYEHLKKCLHQAAKEALGEVVVRRDKKTKYWINEELINEIRTKKQLFAKWLSTYEDKDKYNYIIQRRRVRNLIRKEKQQSWERKCKEIEMYIGGRKTTEVWKYIRNIKSPCRENVQIHGITVNNGKSISVNC